MTLKEDFGRNIKKYRKLNRITQEKLAELIGVEINTISAFECGRYFPSPENLSKISAALNVSLSDLFNFNEDRSCEEFQKEILSNINLINQDKTKLAAVNSFIKSIIN